jgi:hypothetical protein
MPKNKIGDLRDHLFAQLEALRDTDANLDQEINRAKSVAEVARVIIESAKVEVETLMIDRGKVFRSLARVTEPGGHVVWLDTVWPMHSKEEWRTVGRICLIRSTNHRVRLISIFERQAA